MRLIDADKLPIWGFAQVWEEGEGIRKCCEAVKNAPTVDAVPVKFTEEELKIIRIHMNAFKEKLQNQLRWSEAVDYQQIVDKLDVMMDEVTE